MTIIFHLFVSIYIIYQYFCESIGLLFVSFYLCIYSSIYLTYMYSSICMSIYHTCVDLCWSTHIIYIHKNLTVYLYRYIYIYIDLYIFTPWFCFSKETTLDGNRPISWWTQLTQNFKTSSFSIASFMRSFTAFLFLRGLGWRIDGRFNPRKKQDPVWKGGLINPFRKMV